MLKDKLGRRDFMSHVMKILAVATGLSVSEVSRLLTSEGTEIDPDLDIELQQRFNIYQKSSDDEIKALKVLIENNRRIFENEYGRITPITTAEIQGSIKKVCGVNWIKPGEMIDVCRAVFSKGGTCGKLKTCGGNTCSDLKCPELETCDKLTCPGLNCPKLGSCSQLSMINSSFFEKHKSDRYVQHLFERFEVTTSSELATQVKILLDMR